MLAYEQILYIMGCLPYIQEQRRRNAEMKLTSVNSNLELMLTTVSGSIAGVLSWIFVIPFDVIKTIMQAEPNPYVYKNMFHCISVNVKVSFFREFSYVAFFFLLNSIFYFLSEKWLEIPFSWKLYASREGSPSKCSYFYWL